MHARRWERARQVIAVFGIVTFGAAAGAAAQQPRGGSSSERKWSVTFYGGFVTGGAPTGGSGFLPAVGETFIPLPGAPPSRRVSTWWLGDGTTLLNDVVRLTTPPAPPGSTPPPSLLALDPLVMSAPAERRPGGSFGVRATRRLASHLDLELSVDVGLQKLSITDEAKNAIHTTRASFPTTFNALLSRTSQQNRIVEADATIPDATGSQTAVTAAILYGFRPGHDVEPYVVAGGGWLKSSGSAEYTLVGRYSFTSGPTATGETDTLRVITDWSNSPVAIVGAGIRRATSDRAGFAVDVRLQIGSPNPRTHIEATPARDPNPSQSFGAVAFLTNPSLAIVGMNSLGFESTLTGPAITDFTTFDGSGTFMTVHVTIGYFVRF